MTIQNLCSLLLLKMSEDEDDDGDGILDDDEDFDGDGLTNAEDDDDDGDGTPRNFIRDLKRRKYVTLYRSGFCACVVHSYIRT